MIHSQYTQGVATIDQLLVAQDQLTTSIADLQTSLRDREQYEHALAVLVGVAPSESAVASRNDFTFVLPRPPLTLLSTLFLRRPDVVAAERSAANVRSQEAQLRAGTVSQEAMLTQQLVLPQAEQNLRDTQGQLSHGSVALIQSLGGSWQAIGH